ncbi:MAG: glycolate oxidase subunit GlcE [Acidiferrobacterales bacterium]
MAKKDESVDQTALLSESVCHAAENGTALIVQGGGSKSFYGRLPEGQLLDVSRHRGLVTYEPTDLVITARAGTPLREIETVLANHNQMLAFEPPHFGPNSTLGGAVAAGLSGPRRPYSGSVRDFVLGIKMINGKGEVLKFGGQVIKNVAGYDISRLLTGSLGTLGILLEISLKVLPKPEVELTVTHESNSNDAIQFFNKCAGRPLPVSAACHINHHTYLRLAGTEQGVRAAQAKIGGEVLGDGKEFWKSVREQTHVFFDGSTPLWRLSVSSTSPPFEQQGEQFIDWGGALRWAKVDDGSRELFDIARIHGGHATLFRHGSRSGEVFQQLSPAMMQIHQKLKSKFDPNGILNPGRMYQAF